MNLQMGQIASLIGVQCYRGVVLISTSLTVSEVEHLFMYLAICFHYYILNVFIS